MSKQQVVKHKGAKAPRKTRTGKSDFDVKFQEHVEKLSNALRIADGTPKQTGPRLFKEGAGGTLEQVGREADSALDGVKRIMALLNVEGKAVDVQSNALSTYNGIIINLSSAIAQGLGDSQRTGDSLKITRIRGKLLCAYATADTCITFVFGRSKDGVPAVADVFDSIGGQYSQMSFENHDQRKADTWLWHRTVSTNSIDRRTNFMEFDFKGNVDTTYVNATTTVSAGCYWLGIICGVASGPTYTTNIRMDFVDN